MNILAESESFIIRNEFEIVFLDFKKQNKSSVIIGDFYGDPEFAFISRDENYLVIGGAGLIVYFLNNPFEKYEHNKTSKQYYEFGRSEGRCLFVVKANQYLSEDDIFFHFEIIRGETKEFWQMNTENKSAELIKIRDNDL